MLELARVLTMNGAMRVSGFSWPNEDSGRLWVETGVRFKGSGCCSQNLEDWMKPTGYFIGGERGIRTLDTA